jgi:hypothetical protein
MKLLRELELTSMPACHLGLKGASVVTALRYDRFCRPLRDEVEHGRLPAFHGLPGLPRIRFRDLVNWYEDEVEKFPGKYRARLDPSLRVHPLSASPQVFAHLCVDHARKIGLLKPEQCLYCGAPAEAHHPDYDKPLWVLWLCHAHHCCHHARLGVSYRQFKRTGRPAQLELFTVSWFTEEARKRLFSLHRTPGGASVNSGNGPTAATLSKRPTGHPGAFVSL